jgi:membrane-bound serine protease (ClpP class)
MFIIGGIYMELQSPGVGLPSAVAITAAILYFTPLYLTGYAEHWEIIIFVLGLILIVFEIFVFPGFGIPGILGIVAVFTGLILALIGNVKFNFENVPALEMFRAIMIVLGGMGMGIIFVIYMSSRIGRPGVFKKVALSADQEGFVSVSLEPAVMVGKSGTAATVLRPSGKVSIDGELYDAVSMKGFIEKGEEVVVKRYENFQLYVVKK